LAEELQAAGQSGVDVIFQIVGRYGMKKNFLSSTIVQKKTNCVVYNYKGVSLLSHCGKVMTIKYDFAENATQNRGYTQ